MDEELLKKELAKLQQQLKVKQLFNDEYICKIRRLKQERDELYEESNKHNKELLSLLVQVKDFSESEIDKMCDSPIYMNEIKRELYNCCREIKYENNYLHSYIEDINHLNDSLNTQISHLKMETQRKDEDILSLISEGMISMEVIDLLKHDVAAKNNEIYTHKNEKKYINEQYELLQRQNKLLKANLRSPLNSLNYGNDILDSGSITKLLSDRSGIQTLKNDFKQIKNEFIENKKTNNSLNKDEIHVNELKSKSKDKNYTKVSANKLNNKKCMREINITNYFRCDEDQIDAPKQIASDINGSLYVISDNKVKMAAEEKIGLYIGEQKMAPCPSITGSSCVINELLCDYNDNKIIGDEHKTVTKAGINKLLTGTSETSEDRVLSDDKKVLELSLLNDDVLTMNCVIKYTENVGSANKLRMNADNKIRMNGNANNVLRNEITLNFMNSKQNIFEQNENVINTYWMVLGCGNGKYLDKYMKLIVVLNTYIKTVIVYYSVLIIVYIVTVYNILSILLGVEVIKRLSTLILSHAENINILCGYCKMLLRIINALNKLKINQELDNVTQNKNINGLNIKYMLPIMEPNKSAEFIRVISELGTDHISYQLISHTKFTVALTLLCVLDANYIIKHPQQLHYAGNNAVRIRSDRYYYSY